MTQPVNKERELNAPQKISQPSLAVILRNLEDAIEVIEVTIATMTADLDTIRRRITP